MQSRTYAAVIPVIPKHIKYLLPLLSELMDATKKFNEIWVIASSQNAKSTHELHQIKELYFSERIYLDIYQDDKTAGENRNIGFEKVSSDFICFLDADDSYSPRRLEILDKVIEITGAEILLHDYFRLLPKIVFKLNKKLSLSNLATKNELAAASFSEEGIRKNLDTTKGGYTNLLLPIELRRFHRIQHGHVTVSNQISERFSSIPIGEDGEFARRCLQNGRNVVYIPLRLSIYDRATLSNLFSSFYKRLFYTLAMIKVKILSKIIRSRNL